MYHTLDIFDFDGTLFQSPQDSDENKKLYEKHTGIPWHLSKSQAAELTKRLKKPINPRSGWWGKPETLQAPLVPDPAPKSMWNEDVVQDFMRSRENPETLTVIMTGRHAGLKKEVFRILYDGKLVNISRCHKSDGTFFYENSDNLVSIYLLGMDGPNPSKVSRLKPSSTREWKAWVMEQYLELHPSIGKVRFWEDRVEHAEYFRSLSDELAMKIEVNLIA